MIDETHVAVVAYRHRTHHHSTTTTSGGGSSVPGVVIMGAIVGVVLIALAIRAMFKK